jgi:protein-histidine pros-kinase
MATRTVNRDEPRVQPSRTSLRTVQHLVTAIGRGEIDALVLPTPQGERVFTCWTDEQPYRILIEAISEGALTLSPDGTILYCNSAFARIVGASLEKVIGASLCALVDPSEATKLRDLLALASEGPVRAEMLLTGGARRGVPVYVSARPLPVEERGRICAVVTDLTEVNEARTEQKRLAEIVESAADAVLSTTRQGVVTSWNRGAERLLGYSSQEMVGTSILQTVPVEGCAEFLTLLERLRHGNSAENVELQQQRKDGSRIDAVLTISPIRDRQGTITAASVIIRDNTARKRALRRLQNVLEAAPDAIVVVNHNGTIVLANGQAEVLFGHDRREMIGHPLTLLLPFCFEQFHSKWFGQDPNERPSGARHDTPGIRADRSEFPAEVSVGALEVEEGTLLCTSVRNISERYAMQHALREKNAQLQAALHAKDRFLATMSHELRTPLTAIIGFVGLLLMKISGPLTDLQVGQLELVRASARHLLAIISDLLDLARIEAGKVPLEKQEFPSLEVVEEVVRELIEPARQKGLRLEICMEERPLLLYTDRRLLRQILSNLVSNAVKYTREGSVRVCCRLNAGSIRPTVSLAVQDTGIGVRPEDLSRLFVAFFRAQTSAADRCEGTGLGLHLGQKLAILLGGRITVESTVNQGSTFTLTLPVGDIADDRD